MTLILFLPKSFSDRTILEKKNEKRVFINYDYIECKTVFETV